MTSKVLSSLVVLCLSGAAWAQVSPTCEMPQAIDKYQLLRRLSLDLRGHPPQVAEYNELDNLDTVPDTTVQQYLQSDEFRVAMRHYHELMFWPNVSNVQLNNTNSGLTVSSGFVKGNNVIDHVFGRTYNRGPRQYSCGDDQVVGAVDGGWVVNQSDGGAITLSFLQTHFLDGGHFEPDPAFVRTVTLSDGGTAKDEGYRMVVPYWDTSGTAIPVCAYDAQETPTSAGVGGNAASPYKDNDGTVLGSLPCNDFRTNGDMACGCGPNLSYCFGGPLPASLGGGTGTSAGALIEANLREQLDRSVDDVTVGGAPYTDLIASSKAWENGTIAFWKQNLAPDLSFTNVVSFRDPQEPNRTSPTFLDQTGWQKVDLGSIHAGVETLPAYLLRFQTDRGRANRFRIDFMCQYFVPQTVLTAQPGCDPLAPDLTNRCYCQYCHEHLEPLASYFGLYSEAGSTLMSDTHFFPKMDSACKNSTSAFCTRYYVTDPTAPNPGSLLPTQFAAQHTDSADGLDYTQNMTGGPGLWAQRIIADHTFSQCQVQNVFNYLVKRPMVLGSGDASDETALLQSLSTGFEQSNYSFPWLVQQIVSLPQYRRVR